MNKKDFEILEGIRGLAAFVVVLNHARGYLFVGGRAYLDSADASFWDKLMIGLFQVTSLGVHAVIVFFVLSGFSIAHSVAHGGSAGWFYLRRVIRLAPPCAGGLALAWVAYMAVPQALSLRAFIPQYWSLYHEAIFYAGAPLLVAAAWRLHFATAATVGYVAGLVLGPGDILHNFVFQYAFYFSVGVLAYHHRDVLQRLILGKKAFTLACMVALVVMAATIGSLPRLGLLIAAAFSLLLIANFQAHGITSSPLRRLGSMSYTLYVTHYAAIVLWALWLQHMGWIQGRATFNPWLWMTAVPFALAVSLAMYWIIEKPATTLLKRLRERRDSSSTRVLLR